MDATQWLIGRQYACSTEKTCLHNIRENLKRKSPENVQSESSQSPVRIILTSGHISKHIYAFRVGHN